jgi:hypothetical protein
VFLVSRGVRLRFGLSRPGTSLVSQEPDFSGHRDLVGILFKLIGGIASRQQPMIAEFFKRGGRQEFYLLRPLAKSVAFCVCHLSIEMRPPLRRLRKKIAFFCQLQPSDLRGRERERRDRHILSLICRERGCLERRAKRSPLASGILYQIKSSSVNGFSHRARINASQRAASFPRLHSASPQLLNETIKDEKLKVDKSKEHHYIVHIDICLLSFDYRALAPRPERTFLSKIAIIIRSAFARRVPQYCYERVHHDHWHS